VATGTTTFRLGHPPRAEQIEFDTGNVAVVPRDGGSYRVDVDPNANRTTVTVWTGGADLHTGDQSVGLDAGHSATIDGTGDDARIAFGDAPSPTEWDQWELARNERIERAPSYRRVSTNVYGAEDLDDAGTWSDDRSYGPIWRPTHVEAGWAPFTQGRWVWEDPWGWVWVDDAPWGWAP